MVGRRLQLDDQTPYAPFPVVLHPTHARPGRRAGGSSGSSGSSGSDVSESPPTPVLHVRVKERKHRAADVIHVAAFAIHVGDLTVQLAER
jgi:hypothetical protein